MDYFRKFFGFPIPGYNDHLQDHDDWASNNDSFPFDPHEFDAQHFPFDLHQDGMRDAMQQMDQVFTLMDRLMTGMGSFTYPFEHGVTQDQFPSLEQPNSMHPPPSSPRDALLKNPDSVLPNTPDSSTVHDKQAPGTDDQHVQMLPYENSPNFGHDRAQGPLRDAFSLLEQFSGIFGNTDSFSWSHSHGGDIVDPSESDKSPRDTLIKREDQDVDIESKSDINSLLKDGPGYSYKDKNRDDTQLQPYGDGTKLQPYSHPDIKRTFTSTSISRIVKPDGSIEERRTYRDSSGKEEVTVTHVDPQQEGPGPSPFRGPMTPGGGLSGLFGGLFR